MIKRKYERPELDVIVMVAEDILTASSEDIDENQGEWDLLESYGEIQ